MLEFENISHAYGGRLAVDDVSLTAPAGEVTCLIGPSGCGKTTLLRLAAGLMPVQKGRILLDGEVLGGEGKDVPPETRSVGLVFQEGALFPHLTVADNIAFGLRGNESDKRARVADLLSLVEMEGFAKRYPHTLSGGQQQRVALARSLAPAPQVLLFDEPYASLDTKLRHELREQARRMIRRTGVIGIVVSHDPEEVLEMADNVAVLEAGVLKQVGSPEAIFDRPATAKIAAMFGKGQSLPAEIREDGVHHAFGVWPLSALARPVAGPGPVTLVVRPEALSLTADGDGFPVIDLRLAGIQKTVHIEAPDGTVLRAAVNRPVPNEPGNKVRPVPGKASVFAYPAGTV